MSYSTLFLLKPEAEINFMHECERAYGNFASLFTSTVMKFTEFLSLQALF